MDFNSDHMKYIPTTWRRVMTVTQLHLII